MKSPFPYWIDHALVALGISAVFYAASFVVPEATLFLSCALGVMFYVGREYVQYEKYEPDFDWPGLMAPLLFMITIYGIYLCF